MKHNYRIDYENITLRPLLKDDIEKLRIWRNDPKNTIYLSKIPYITKEMQVAWYERYLANNDELCFAIEENQILRRFVGSLSLYKFTDDSCLFGKILIGDIEAHGKKVGLNATKAAIEIAFKKMNRKSVSLNVYADNLAAMNIYIKSGFKIIGTHNDENGIQEHIMIVYQEEA